MTHFLAGWIALGCGLANLLGRKGTTGHRALGLVFALAMCLVAIDAVSRVAAHGAVDPVAALAIVAVGLTVWALLPFLARRPGWVVRHAHRMQWTAICLIAAAANVLTAPVADAVQPIAPRWVLVPAITLAVLVAGWGLARLQEVEVRRVADRFGR